MRAAALAVLVWLVLLSTASARSVTPSARPFLATVVRVKDGDSIVVLTGGKRQVEVRLIGIDCPERGQPFGDRAKQATSALCFRRTVRVVPDGLDRYRRTLAEVHLPDGSSLNRTLVQQGLAWRYRTSTDPGLLRLQEQARAARRGLWADAKPVPPWDWRRAH